MHNRDNNCLRKPRPNQRKPPEQCEAAGHQMTVKIQLYL